MNKYRVLRAYPKQITNSGRLLTLRPNSYVYLKREGQVINLIRAGYISPVVELPKKVKKPAANKPNIEKQVVQQESNSQSKSEYLSKKKGRSVENEDKSI